ncbi:MAG: RNA chaperone Hfq [Oscillospiraceae bacterium]|nr:RNA chaperone Hfq [Oscillospiraceae bacterium]
MKGQMNMQDAIINQIRKEHIQVTMYLVNGIQLKGLIKGFDSFTVVLESDGKQHMIYKHAISTIIPSKQVRLEQPPEEGE